jgi:two-component system response regulator RegA
VSEKPKRKILVVAGDIAVGRRVHKALQSADVEVDIALNGEEALKKDTAAAYDLILADLKVSGTGDLDLLRSIKARRPGAAVIVIAGSRTIKTAVDAMKLGASDYLPKSVKAADLRAAADPSLIRHDPYGRGFLFRIQATSLDRDIGGHLRAR